MLSDADAAALYDVQSPWDTERSPADAFYHELVTAARDVLDVGCGTGLMLHHARACGHKGRLVGVDPDVAALERAQRRTDIEWVDGRAADMTWDREFDLAVMASHAFQFLISDDDVRTSLVAIREALRSGGVFAVETRNPQVRAWVDWNPSNGKEVIEDSGRALRVWHEVESVVDGVVTLTESVADIDGSVLRIDRGSLRFLDLSELNRFLTDAELVIDAQYGDWNREPIADSSPEIITIARRP